MGRMKEERLREEQRLAKVAPEMLVALREVAFENHLLNHSLMIGIDECGMTTCKQARRVIEQAYHA